MPNPSQLILSGLSSLTSRGRSPPRLRVRVFRQALSIRHLHCELGSLGLLVAASGARPQASQSGVEGHGNAKVGVWTEPCKVNRWLELQATKDTHSLLLLMKFSQLPLTSCDLSFLFFSRAPDESSISSPGCLAGAFIPVSSILAACLLGKHNPCGCKTEDSNKQQIRYHLFAVGFFEA